MSDNFEAWKNYSFTQTAGAVTADIAISPAVGPNERFEVADGLVTVDAAATTAGGTSVRVGFGAAVVPAASSTANTPAVGVLFDHQGVAAGSGGPLMGGIGARGEELRAQVADPTVGSVVITFRGRVIQAA